MPNNIENVPYSPEVEQEELSQERGPKYTPEERDRIWQEEQDKMKQMEKTDRVPTPEEREALLKRLNDERERTREADHEKHFERVEREGRIRMREMLLKEHPEIKFKDEIPPIEEERILDDKSDRSAEPAGKEAAKQAVADAENKAYARKQYEQDQQKERAVKNISELISRKKQELEKPDKLARQQELEPRTIEKKREQSGKLVNLDQEEQRQANKEARDEFFREREKAYAASPELKMTALDEREFSNYRELFWDKYKNVLREKNPGISDELLAKMKPGFEAATPYKEIFDPRKRGWEERLNRPKVKKMVEVGPEDNRYWEAIVKRVVATEPTWTEREIRSYVNQLREQYELTGDLDDISYDFPEDPAFRQKLEKEQTLGRTIKSLFSFKNKK